MIQHCSLRHPTSAADSCYAGGTGERSSCSITLLTPACAPTTWACGFHCCVRCAINVEATLKRPVPSRPHLSHAMETEPVLESKAAVDSTLDDASYDHNTEGEPTESAHEWLETRFGMVIPRKIARRVLHSRTNSCDFVPAAHALSIAHSCQTRALRGSGLGLGSTTRHFTSLPLIA